MQLTYVHRGLFWVQYNEFNQQHLLPQTIMFFVFLKKKKKSFSEALAQCAKFLRIKKAF